MVLGQALSALFAGVLFVCSVFVGLLLKRLHGRIGTKNILQAILVGINVGALKHGIAGLGSPEVGLHFGDHRLTWRLCQVFTFTVLSDL